MEKFKEAPIAFFTVYVREPHPGEARFWKYQQPQNLEEKLANARLLVKQKKVTMPVLVDGMDELAHRRFGRLPNMTYVIDKESRIVYKSMWTRHQELLQFLFELCRSDENCASAESAGADQAVGA